jgi:polyferredoxin
MHELTVLSQEVKTPKRRKRKRAWPWRRTVQIGFAVLNLALGWQFYRFAHAAQTTTSGPLPTRPPGVEGWLPISGLMGAMDWIAHGKLNSIHPAATILLLAFTVIALVFRKAFCAWICPVGLISESLAALGRKIFGRNFRPPKMLDHGLMSIKYILLGFFLLAFVVMGMTGIAAFLQSPYNRVSDVKMLLFFAQLSTTAGIVIGALAVGSIFIEGFWCRYLCPYGAYLGLFSWLSPVKVRRNVPTCIDCGKCDRACPAHLPVMFKEQIISVECNGCMECVNVCPVPDTLSLGTTTRKFSPLKMGIFVLLMFTLFYTGARLLGAWQSSLTDDEYRQHISRLDQPEYGHPGR